MGLPPWHNTCRTCGRAFLQERSRRGRRALTCSPLCKHRRDRQIRNGKRNALALPEEKEPAA